jgi:hypothetical protein
MNIPPFLKQQYINLDTGYLTDPVHFYHEQVNQQLQFNYSDSGLIVPSLNSQTISHVSNSDTLNSKPNGTFFHNEETGKMQVKLGGTVKTLVTE